MRRGTTLHKRYPLALKGKILLWIPLLLSKSENNQFRKSPIDSFFDRDWEATTTKERERRRWNMSAGRSMENTQILFWCGGAAALCSKGSRLPSQTVRRKCIFLGLKKTLWVSPKTRPKVILLQMAPTKLNSTPNSWNSEKISSMWNSVISRPGDLAPSNKTPPPPPQATCFVF